MIKYFLQDAYLRFYFAFIYPNIKKILSDTQKNIFSIISQGGAFYSWLGKSFEYLCIQHADKISTILGFSGIDFSFGPYFCPFDKNSDKNSRGVQIDLIFDRADHVITLCEIKYSNQVIGIEIVDEIEKKVNILIRKFKNKTIQRVLITQNEPSKELISMGYFYRIITAQELLL
jgi:hypothetical protein